MREPIQIDRRPLSRRQLLAGATGLLLASAGPTIGAAKKKPKTRTVIRTFSDLSPLLLSGVTSTLSLVSEVLVPEEFSAASIVGVAVSLNQISYDTPEGLNLFLIRNGKNYTFLSDAAAGAPMLGLDLTFDDTAKKSLPATGPVTSGKYKPANVDAEDADGTLGNRQIGFRSLYKTSPEGVWQLMSFTDFPGTQGQILTGWTLELTLKIRR